MSVKRLDVKYRARLSLNTNCGFMHSGQHQPKTNEAEKETACFPFWQRKLESVLIALKIQLETPENVGYTNIIKRITNMIVLVIALHWMSNWILLIIVFVETNHTSLFTDHNMVTLITWITILMKLITLIDHDTGHTDHTDHNSVHTL